MSLILSEDENSFVGVKTAERDEWLRITDWEVRRFAPSFFSFALAFVKQFFSERSYKRRGVDFRQTSADEVRSAYGAMDPRGFEGINARQQWANWRTIPRSMKGNIPDRPVRVLDLGCGAGNSTQILAWYLPKGSQILGIDLTPQLLDLAKRKTFRRRDGEVLKVEFSLQSATDPYRHSSGSTVADESMDFVNTSGIVGHHLEIPQLEQVVSEVYRILKKGARAAIDCGPHLRKKQIVPAFEKAGFKYLKRSKAIFFDPRGQLVFKKI